MSGTKGKGNKHPKQLDGKRVMFSKQRQPSPAQKAAGWAKKRKGQELAKFILEQKFIGAEKSKLRGLISSYFGVDEKQITTEMMILFRVIEKAIQKADIAAVKLLLERAYGLPKQVSEFNINKPEIKIYTDSQTKADIDKL